MGLFKNKYAKAGPGIPTYGPKKTGAALYFDILWRKIWKLLVLNMVYTAFFLPLLIGVVLFFKIENITLKLVALGGCVLLFTVLIGPATAGLTRVMRRFVIEKPSFIMHDFFKGFKENFARASVIGFVDVIITVSIVSGFKIYPYLAETTGSKIFYVMYAVSLSVALSVIMMNFYLFLMLTATDLSFKDLLKNSFTLAILAIKTSIITFIIVAVVIAAIVLFLPLEIVMMILPFFPFAFLAFTISFMCYPVIQKYVINPFYTEQGLVNPELTQDDDDDEERICQDMGGLEQPMTEEPVKKRAKGKGRRIS